jgi:perosamine synthetase
MGDYSRYKPQDRKYVDLKAHRANTRKRINQIQPDITEREVGAVAKYLRSGGWLTEFEETAKFERKIAEFLKVKHAVLVPNGTIALYLALLAIGAQKGDKVIVPDYTMIATPNSVKWSGAEVSLCDIEEKNLCLDLTKTQVEKSTKALMYVPINGRSGDMHEVADFCKDHEIRLIEDACQAFGSKWNGQFLGTFGEVGVFSFTPHKLITTGQGGAIVTDNEEIDICVRRLKDFHRIRPGVDVHTGVGYNFKFTDLQAVIGMEQLSTIERRMQRKKDIFATYVSELESTEAVGFLPTDLSQVVPWFVDAIVEGEREKLASYLESRNIGSRPFYPPIHSQLPYERVEDDFKVASSIPPKGLWLPSSIKLTKADIRTVASDVNRFYAILS